MSRPAGFGNAPAREAGTTLAAPNTLIWAKLRGYPWWPGRVKSLDEAPPELASIARTQYRVGTVVAVYFFGSHDFSLVPVDCLRPLLPNWDLFSARSAGARFQRALVEARNPEKYCHFERTHQQPAKEDDGKPSSAMIAEPPPVKRKRGRPPKSRPPPPLLQEEERSSSGGGVSAPPATKEESNHGRILRVKSRPLQRRGSTGEATREHIMYCRIKLQKILLRDQPKPVEIPHAVKILTVLGGSSVPLESIKTTNIGRVLRLASRKAAFTLDGPFPEIGRLLKTILTGWRDNAERHLASLGL